MTTTEKRITTIFNEWAARYAANPDEFGEILDESGNPVEDYGESCMRYFVKIANEMDDADLLPRPSVENAKGEPRRGKAEKRSDGGFGVGSCALLCFLFSSVDASAASSPLDQIPSPSASSLCFAFLFAVLMSLLAAWRNPTHVEIPMNNPVKPLQLSDAVKIAQQKRECMKTTDSSTSFAQENHDGNT